MNTLFYYNYLFYKWSKVETQPILSAWFSLSFSEMIFVMGFSDYLSSLIFKHTIDNWILFGIILLPFVFNYFYYVKKGYAKKIIKEKPMFFKSHFLSIVLSWSFLILTFASLILFKFFINRMLV